MVATNPTRATHPRALAIVPASPGRPRPRWRQRLGNVAAGLLWVTLGGVCVLVWTCVAVGAVVGLQWLWQRL